MNQYKIRVNNESESREAQELFFELGYEWGVTGSDISYTDKEYLFAGKLGDLTFSSKNDTFNDSDYYEIALPQLRELAKPKGEFISGADALRALADGVKPCEIEGKFIAGLNSMFVSMDGKVENFVKYLDAKVFRIKPCTVKLEIEVPAPFDPKVGECYWYLNSYHESGYDSRILTENPCGFYHNQAWRTEAEIKIVVKQLRKLKGLGK